MQGSIRVTHNRDIVPSVPPMWVGFHHVATEVWQVDFDVAHVRLLLAALNTRLRYALIASELLSELDSLLQGSNECASSSCCPEHKAEIRVDSILISIRAG